MISLDSFVDEMEKIAGLKSKLVGAAAGLSLAGGYGAAMKNDPVAKAAVGAASDGFKSLRQKALKNVQPTNDAIRKSMHPVSIK